mmetsp:Transcript_11818/g.23768  ORF Transcript_11818/g.23768 Transcript_11818/m.23768 type:complete len:204 (+) Transcript_11818:110-721(+)
MKTTTLLAIAATTSTTQAFTTSTNNVRTQTSLNMGLFDGVKDAFGSSGMGDLDAQRETPIDRWMGWNTKKEAEQGSVSKAPSDFIDSMDEKNYISVNLPKPMGIVFEENDSEFGGIFVLEINEGSNAETEGTVRPGDQLVAVGTKKVSGLAFEDALGAIIESSEEKTKLVFFRGPSKFLYGPAGASAEWLDEFVGAAKVESTA